METFTLLAWIHISSGSALHIVAHQFAALHFGGLR
jgi:hypothetical protein